jgi:hypothetical protein
VLFRSHIESFDQINPQCAELVGHWRIDVRIATGDLVTGLFGDCCDAAHEGAANAEYVDVHT